jgi:hypothetical protein
MVALARNTVLNVKLTNTGGSLQSATPITLKNQVSEIKSIEDIRDVSEVEVVAGATLVYNSQNDKYEVRKINSEDFGTINLDGGDF